MQRSKLTLGIDLGTNSCGWAVVETTHRRIVAAGVRVFPEGVDNLGQGEREQSPNAARREARQRRRQGFRRKLRKARTLDLLAAHRLSPGDAAALANTPETFAEWFRLNPYELRARGVEGPLTPLEFGRALYHIAQRRGFQSNSRRALAKEADEKSKILEGTDDKPGIAGLAKRLEDSGQTLGQYLYALHPEPEQPFEQRDERIRNRWTSRAMYVEEFERLWSEQARHHPTLLTPALRDQLGGRRGLAIPDDPQGRTYTLDGELFFQRPLRSARGQVGKGRFERVKPRVHRSHPLFEEFRARQFINSIRVDDRPLVGQEREKAWRWMRKKDRDQKFLALRKHLKLADSYHGFNYADDDRFACCPTIARLSHKRAFGDAWFELSEGEREDRWHVLHGADDVDWLRAYAKTRWGLPPDKADYLARKLRLDEGYGSLSRKAIRNILPFLRDRRDEPIVYSEAVALGGVRAGFGDSRWERLPDDERAGLVEAVLTLVRAGEVGGYQQRLRDWLEAHYGWSEKQLDGLYHHSREEGGVGVSDRIPTKGEEGKRVDEHIESLRNPVVATALYELRRTVNAVAEAHGRHEDFPFDAIHLEMGKDLKGSKEARQRIARSQKERREVNRAADEFLEANGVEVNYVNRLKKKLWDECQHTCPYTGRRIGVTALFGTTPAFEIEHIIPYSRSLDDSWTNLTLCATEVNRDKGNRTPYEYFSELGTWEQAKARALSLFKTSREYPNRYAKFKRFAVEKLEGDFIQRQLNDTRYAAREGRKLLQQIVAQREDVVVLPGRLTGELRHLWGLNSLLGDDPNDAPETRAKNRADQRHHALDAIVVAMSSQGVFQRLAEWEKYRRRAGERFELDAPWENFRLDAKEALEGILVSYRRNNRVLTTGKTRTEKLRDGRKVTHVNDVHSARGQLHKETVFGRRRRSSEDPLAYHVRKPITEIKDLKQLGKVADAGVRRAMRDVARRQGVDVDDPKANIPPGTFTYRDEDGGPARYRVHLPNRRGEPVPVKRVRVRENLSQAVELKDDANQHVNPRNNHHVLVYERRDGSLAEEVVTLWEATARLNRGEPLVQLPPDGAHVVTTLEINDMFLLGIEMDEGDLEHADRSLVSEHLFRVQKLSHGYYTFRHHLASTLQYEDQERRIQSMKRFVTEGPIKVFVDPAGNLSIRT